LQRVLEELKKRKRFVGAIAVTSQGANEHFLAVNALLRLDNAPIDRRKMLVPILAIHLPTVPTHFPASLRPLAVVRPVHVLRAAHSAGLLQQQPQRPL
jgi:hypothetical protein